MKLKKTYPYVRFGALILMAAYLFIVVTHLFFTPRFGNGPAHGYNPALKRNTVLIYTLIRTDRGLFNESKKAKTFAKNHTASFIALLADRKPSGTLANSHDNFSQFSTDHHYSYLSNRILRM